MYKYKTRKNKNRIQKIFYNNIEENFSTALILAGPNVRNAVKFVKDIAKNIISYEIDPATYLKQKKFSTRSLKFKLGDIASAEAVNFIDADLMKTMETNYGRISDLLKKQSNLEGKKVFIGTTSMRSCSKRTTIKFLKCILYNILKKYDLEYYTYADREGPMFTFKITYL